MAVRAPRGPLHQPGPGFGAPASRGSYPPALDNPWHCVWGRLRYPRALSSTRWGHRQGRQVQQQLLGVGDARGAALAQPPVGSSPLPQEGASGARERWVVTQLPKFTQRARGGLWREPHIL